MNPLLPFFSPPHLDPFSPTLRDAQAALAERALPFDTHGIPVNVDLLVYTEAEWRQILAREDRFAAEMRRIIWL